MYCNVMYWIGMEWYVCMYGMSVWYVCMCVRTYVCMYVCFVGMYGMYGMYCM